MDNALMNYVDRATRAQSHILWLKQRRIFESDVNKELREEKEKIVQKNWEEQMQKKDILEKAKEIFEMKKEEQ